MLDCQSSSDEEDAPLVVESVSTMDNCDNAIAKVLSMPEVAQQNTDAPELEGGIWRHTTRGTIHLHSTLLKRSGDALLCHMFLTGCAYVKLDGWPVKAAGRCKTCFSAAKDVIARSAPDLV